MGLNASGISVRCEDLRAGNVRGLRLIGGNERIVCRRGSPKTSAGRGIATLSPGMSSSTSWVRLLNMKGVPTKDKYFSIRGKTCSSFSGDNSTSPPLLSLLASVASSSHSTGIRAAQGGVAPFAIRSWASLADGN